MGNTIRMEYFRIIHMRLLFLLLLLVAGISSCGKKDMSVNQISSQIYTNPSEELILKKSYQLISENDRERIWQSLSDTSQSINEAIEIVNSIKDLPLRFKSSLHLTFLDIWTVKALGESQNTKSSQEHNRIALKIDHAQKKIVNEMQELYEDEILFDCILAESNLSPRYVFLDNNEVHLMNGFFIATQEVRPWRLKGDTIVFEYNDTLTLHLVPGDKYLRPTKHKRFYFEYLRPPNLESIKKSRHFGISTSSMTGERD